MAGSITLIALTGSPVRVGNAEGVVSRERIAAARFLPNAILRWNHGARDSYCIGSLRQWWLQGDDEWCARFTIDDHRNPFVRHALNNALQGRAGVSAGYRSLVTWWEGLDGRSYAIHTNRNEHRRDPPVSELKRAFRGEVEIETFALVMEVSIVPDAADSRCRVLALDLPAV